MKHLSLLDLSDIIAKRYQNYLSTSFYFRDARLRGSFREALAGESLIQGPFLEATGAFRLGKTPRQLAAELGIPADEGFLSAIHGDRPLYEHQEQSIRRAESGGNVIVATGTGSGKTESFLLPILFHLYKESLAGTLGPGVRALILYPMNALSNDQRDRLGAICRRLEKSSSSFRFTFGQYIGDTPEDEGDGWRSGEERARNRLPGELVFRKEMRENPPNILLTNFSMLEYLLIRPYDSPLFDDGSARWWNFIVMDEAHQYRGAKGMEMAMLVRRLKQRLRDGGRDRPIQCIATSATLTGGGGDRTGAARFGRDLFGEPFDEAGVLLGAKVTMPDAGKYALSPSDYSAIAGTLSDGRPEAFALTKIAEEKGAVILSTLDPHRLNEERLRLLAGEILLRDKRTLQLQYMLRDGPVEVSRLATELFPEVAEDERIRALEEMVGAVSSAAGEGGGSLFSPRFHLFIRSLEGAFITFLPVRAIRLARGADDAAWFELALCRNCGQHYLVGKVDNGPHGRMFSEPNRDPSHPEFGVEYLLPLDDPALELEADDGGARKKSAGAARLLCVRCQAIWPEGSPNTCDHAEEPNAILRVLWQRSRNDRYYPDALPRCLACGHAENDPVKEVVHGSDGPNAVIATAIHEHLPEGRRRILAFADSRQEAAFFASYLDSTYEGIMSRNHIYRVAKKLSTLYSEGLSLRDIAGELAALLRSISPDDDPNVTPAQIDMKAWTAVLKEFVSHSKRRSLEGVGLGYWFVQWPRWFRIPAHLKDSPWNLDEETGRALLVMLLNIMRTNRRAVAYSDLPPTSILWSDISPYPQYRVRLGTPKGQRNVMSWDSPKASGAKLLTKFLRRRRVSSTIASERAVSALRAFWKAMIDPDHSPDGQKFLLPAADGRRLNPLWWRFKTLSENDEMYRCTVCHQCYHVDIGICPRPLCPGSMEKLQVKHLGPDHYRTLYESDLPPTMRAEEHTAQLARDKASNYQREFKKGKISVLSSSTTFELGVDLGDLDIVFLRNVPPEPFNYIQRVGRAGRRAGQPGFAITYCRRSPHDLYHFPRPERMLRGTSNPPVIHLKNEKILLRHMGAAVLGEFFKKNQHRFRNVKDFVVDMAQPRAAADLNMFMRTRQRDLEGILLQIAPEEMQIPLGLHDGSWFERIAAAHPEGVPSPLNDAEAELAQDYRSARKLEEESSADKKHRVADWARKRISSLEKEDVLSFLSRKAIIPKYGFPVDVVSLETFNGDVELQRDRSQAISEYAPTAEVVANKKIWRSAGLKTVAGRQWPKRYYRSCTDHNRFDVWDHAQGPKAPEPPCCSKMSPPKQYVIPWFGFVSRRSGGGGQPLKRRPARLFSSRPFFIGFTENVGEEVLLPSPTQPLVSVSRAAPGTMGIISEGRRNQGFFVCTHCGAGFTKREGSHKTPMGSNCRGSLEWLSLGHEFITDIVKVDFIDDSPLPSEEKLWFAYGLAFALAAAAAEVLEVPETDLSSTVGSSRGWATPPVFLYDNVPGGAGLVSRLEEEDIFVKVLSEALERVSGGCGCGSEDSCYGCLRSYRNQFAHPRLRRGPIREFVENILAHWDSPAADAVEGTLPF